MKYDFSKSLHNSKEAIVKVADDDTSAYTVMHALKDAVLADTQQNQESKLARYELWLKLRQHTPDTDYSLDEVSLLKKCAMTMPTVFAGQVSHLLDQKA